MDNILRVNTYIDGQNLYRTVKQSFGYNYPNCNVIKLSNSIIPRIQPKIDTAEFPNFILELNKAHFYTGIPEIKKDNSPKNLMWSKFWKSKIRTMKNRGVIVYTRPLLYDSNLKGREKGIDIRIALDIVRGYRKGDYDITVIFSQDTDLEEAINEVYDMKTECNNRWIKLVCAFPELSSYNRGLSKTDWITFDKQLYKTCIDSNHYFPPSGSQLSICTN